jgi:hypothetical protein
MPKLKLWLKNRLERMMLTRPMLRTRTLKRSAQTARQLHVVIPHRLNWNLTSATVRAFQRLTTCDFSITLVVNFDSVPKDWEGWKMENLTLVQNEFSALGNLYRALFRSENGSMFNALALHEGLRAEPDFEWAFIAHNDSAPLARGWQEHFFQARNGGLVSGNLRDRFRVFAAHSSGTLFNQREFQNRGGTVWPRYRFGEMQWDVSDGITLSLHDNKKSPVPVLPNNLQNPELGTQLDDSHSVLKKFVENGTNLTFAQDEKTPVFAHMGRGTPRSQQDPFFKHKLPVDFWIDWIDSLR